MELEIREEDEMILNDLQTIVFLSGSKQLGQFRDELLSYRFLLYYPRIQHRLDQQ